MKNEKTKIEARNSKLGEAGPRSGRFSIFGFRVSRLARRSLGVGAAFWAWLRDVTEDSAYERYLVREASARATLSEPEGRVEGSASLLSPAEFYRQRLDDKYSGRSGPARCC